MLPLVQNIEVKKLSPDEGINAPDLVVTEEPLEIRVVAGEGAQRIETPVAVTMRTPGHDFELTLGFLFTEGIINSHEEVLSLRHCKKVKSDLEQDNIAIVKLSEACTFDPKLLHRHQYTSSSCGICGKTSLDLVKTATKHPLSGAFTFSKKMLFTLDKKVEGTQNVFRHTGGLHAAALFNKEGTLIILREDIGRHNAVDKIIGACLSEKKVPLSNCLLWVSGRAGFELVQKATMAGIPAMASVGAPSSLAVSLAKESKMILVGFLRDRKGNAYAGGDRLI